MLHMRPMRPAVKGVAKDFKLDIVSITLRDTVFSFTISQLTVPLTEVYPLPVVVVRTLVPGACNSYRFNVSGSNCLGIIAIAWAYITHHQVDGVTICRET